MAKPCARAGQTWLLSGTDHEGIAKLAGQVMREPVTVKVDAQHAGAQIEQRWYEVKPGERLGAVARLLEHFRPASSLAFCITKVRCCQVVACLQAQRLQSVALYGVLAPPVRDLVPVRFADLRCSVFV